MFTPFSDEEKRRIFNKPFKRGFLVGIAAFLFSNVISYFIADYMYEQYLMKGINFAPAPRFRWGFPFWWDGQNFGYYADGVLNLIVAIAIGFAFGIAFRFLSVRFFNE